MSDIDAVLREQLDTKLAADLAVIAPAVVVKWPGQPTVPPVGKASWVRVTLQPAAQSIAAWGAGGLIKHSGVYVVDFFTPVAAGNGLAIADTFAGALRHLWKPGTRIAGAQDLRITEFRSAGVLDGPVELQVPLSIEYFCYAANT